MVVTASVIEVEHARFAYAGGEFELRVGRLHVGPGETVAVTGPSGSGKTTLLNLISGILTPAAGTIKVAGLELNRLGPEDRQDLRVLKLGLVFQEFELLEYLDVLDNVLLPFRISPVLELSRDARERAASLLGDLGLGSKLRRFPARLSHGERQRVAVARALATGPAAVLGDEPTGNLDAENRDHVAGMLFRYARECGAPLVVSSHDTELVRRFDRTLDVRSLA